MTAAFLNHLWQSTVTTGAIALLMLLLRRNRAQVRYALWFAASMKFCVPFAILISVCSVFATSTAAQLVPATQATTPLLVSTAIDQFAQPFDDFVTAAPAPTAVIDWQSWAIAIWIAGMAVVIAIRIRDYLRVRAMVRASTVLAIDGIVTPAARCRDRTRTVSRPAPRHACRSRAHGCGGGLLVPSARVVDRFATRR